MSTKADVYAALNTINRGFADALESLKTLQAEGVLTELCVHDHTIFAKELLAGLNYVILNRQQSRELEDREHFGKMRVTIEERNRAHEENTSARDTGRDALGENE